MIASRIEIGCRIHCDGEFGTVLYIGTVAGFEETWLGVEWDNPSRGKHSGCYKDVSYFTTRVAGAGSFIKVPKADFGTSCPEAVKIKYGKDIASNKPPSIINLPQKSGLERHIEMVGIEKIMGKQSNFGGLTVVILSGMLINGAGTPNELKELIPSVRDLDLSQNLLSSWSNVNEIIQQLPLVSTLMLSKNRLKIPENREIYQSIYQSLEMLVLDNLAYNWEEVLLCSEMWPSIEKLYLMDNRISSLSVPPPCVFQKLKFLSLDHNTIQSWHEVVKLGHLTNLEELHLENTSLGFVAFPGVSAPLKTEIFPNLKIINLKNNLLTQWRDVSELSKLKCLNSILIAQNPIVQSVNPGTARQLIIAKLSSLKVLNRTEVDRSERRGSELDYLKRYRDEWVASGGNSNLSQGTTSAEFLEEHPTYISLLQRHGAAEETEAKSQSTLIKDNLLRVKIFSPQMPDKPILTKKLPAEMTVGKLKALVQRIFKVAATELTLNILYKQDETKKTEMDNNMKLLSFYSISDQDKIEVKW